MDAALRQVPVALAGDVAEQQLARLEQDDDAAAEAAAGEAAGDGASLDCRRRSARRGRPVAQLRGLGANSSTTRPTRATSARPGRAALACAHAASSPLRLLRHRDRRLRDRLERRRPDRRLAARGHARALRRSAGSRSGSRRRSSPFPQAPLPSVVEAITRLLARRARRLRRRCASTSATPTTSTPGSTPSRGRFPLAAFSPTARSRRGSARGPTAREVGQSLGRNPWPIVVPCHRVVAAGNALGGFSAPGGTATKRRLLAIERARRASADPDLFDESPGRSGRRRRDSQVARPALGTDAARSSSTGVLIDPSGRS